MFVGVYACIFVHIMAGKTVRMRKKTGHMGGKIKGETEELLAILVLIFFSFL